LSFAGFIAVTIARDIDIILLPLSGASWTYGTRLSGLAQAQTLYVMLPGTIALCLVALERWPREEGKSASRKFLVFRKWPILFPLSGIVLSSVAFMITRFRSIWIASFCGLVLLSLMLYHRRMIKILLYPGVAAVLLVLLATQGYLPQVVVDRFHSSFDSQAPDIIARQEAMKRLLPIAVENPLIGIGFNNSKYFLPVELVEGRVGAIHNLLLSNLVENGLLAFLALVVLPLLLLAIYRQVQRRGDPVDRYLGMWAISSFLGIYIGAQLTPNMFDHTFWFLMAYLTGLGAATARGVRQARCIPEQPLTWACLSPQEEYPS
jgi:O-antigen ligase